VTLRLRVQLKDPRSFQTFLTLALLLKKLLLLQLPLDLLRVVIFLLQIDSYLLSPLFLLHEQLLIHLLLLP
jgi:hypothetical protein